MKEKMYKTEEVAEMFGVSKMTVNRWINKGWLACLVMGKTRRIPYDAVRDFLKKVEQPAEPAFNIGIKKE